MAKYYAYAWALQYHTSLNNFDCTLIYLSLSWKPHFPIDLERNNNYIDDMDIFFVWLICSMHDSIRPLPESERDDKLMKIFDNS